MSFDLRFTYLKDGGLMSQSPGPGTDSNSIAEPLHTRSLTRDIQAAVWAHLIIVSDPAGCTPVRSASKQVSITFDTRCQKLTKSRVLVAIVPPCAQVCMTRGT